MELRFKTLVVLLGSAFLSAVLAGCGGGSSSSPSAASGSASGVASKGPLNSAQVCAYAISNGAKGAQLGTCAITSSTGAYLIDFGTYTGPVLLEATGGDYTDEATGATVTLATPLHAMLASATSGVNTAAVTALSELAYRLANANTGGLTTANIQAAIASVQSNFGVADIVANQPVDALNIPGGASADQKTYALALATISQYLNGLPPGTSLAQALQAIEACLADTNSCGTLASDLAAAMSTFQGAHSGFGGMTLPSGSFGAGSGGSGNTPAVSSYTPSSGGVGSTVTISGTNLGNFTPAPLVKFGTTTATVSSATATSIVVTVPSGLAVGGTTITLSNFDGTGSVSVGSFTVTAASGGGSSSACLIDGSTSQYPNAKVCYASLPTPFTCDAAGMHNSAASYIAVAGAPSYTYSSVSSCPSGVTSGTVFTTVAGTGVVSSLAGAAIAQPMTSNLVDGVGSAARFDFVNGVNFSGAGITNDGTYLYVADIGNSAIRKIDTANATVSTLPSSGLTSPQGITSDGTNLYIADNNRSSIYKLVIASGALSTLAGAGGGWGLVDGTGSTVRFHSPVGITNDGANLYVSDTLNHVIRKIVLASGAVTTLAGSGSSGSADGTGAAASFNQPRGITADGGNLYVVDGFNSTIRKIEIATGVVTTLAGSAGNAGTRDGVGTAALFYHPDGIVSDGTYLYVTDYNLLVRKIDIATATVTTLAGGTAGSVDGTGDAARFNMLGGITRIGSKLYLTDNYSAIRAIQ
ncbi:MAG: hypothetical protein HGA75_04580 [Thiobacillus sp.]|nr:hypothetical protein [Thiobacillus sp.]